LSRAGLAKSGAFTIFIRVLIACLITWFPLLVLSIGDGRALGSAVQVPFLHDFANHVRFLFAIPIFMTAEVFIEPQLRKAAAQFLRRGIVGEAELAGYHKAVRQTRKLSRSILPEMFILGIVISAAALGVRAEISPEITSWRFRATGGGTALTAAGWWFVTVSMPAFQFLFLRCLWWCLEWAFFLWRVSRLNLRMVPTHPDEVGGLGFLGVAQGRFAPIVFGLGAVNSSVIGEKILYEGSALPAFKTDITVYLSLILLFFLAPLLVFTPRLLEARRKGLREYGALASGYVEAFDRKWLRGKVAEGKDLLGSGDIQSLADLGNSFAIIKGMKPIPFGRNTVIVLAAAALLPMVPLLLTIYTPMQILQVIKGIIL
jgi:hypothetical protein